MINIEPQKSKKHFEIRYSLFDILQFVLKIPKIMALPNNCFIQATIQPPPRTSSLS